MEKTGERVRKSGFRLFFEFNKYFHESLSVSPFLFPLPHLPPPFLCFWTENQKALCISLIMKQKPSFTQERLSSEGFHPWPCQSYAAAAPQPCSCLATYPTDLDSDTTLQTLFPRLTLDMPYHYRLAWQSLHCVWPQLLSWPDPGPDPQTCLITVLIHQTGLLPDLGCHHWASQLASPRRCRAAPLLVRILASTSLVLPLSLRLPGTAHELARQPHCFLPELWPQLIPYNVQGLTGPHHNGNVAQEPSFHPLLFSKGLAFSPYKEKGGRMQLLANKAVKSCVHLSYNCTEI